MAVKSDYVTGTITLTNGSLTFTGAGTAWQLAGFREGDEIKQVEGQTQWEAMVATIDSNTAGTLVRPWGGATGTYAYRMRFQPDGSRVTAQARELIELLGKGNLQAEALIDGAGGNWLSYFTGVGTKARTSFTAKARTLLGKSSNAEILTELGAQAAGNYQPAGNYQTALGFAPINKAGDTGVGDLSFSGSVRQLGLPLAKIGWSGYNNFFPAGSLWGPYGAAAIQQGGIYQGNVVGAGGAAAHVTKPGYYEVRMPVITSGSQGGLAVVRNGLSTDAACIVGRNSGSGEASLAAAGIIFMNANDWLAYYAFEAITAYMSLNHTHMQIRYLG